MNVIDTVGAGDNFLAGFIYQFLQHKEPKEMLAFACALGAIVASQRGATPEVSMNDILTFMNPQ